MSLLSCAFGLERKTLIGAFAALFMGHAGLAETPTRSPIEGIAVLDCDPQMVSLSNGCSLRIPPLQSRGEMRKSVDDGVGEFEFIRGDDSDFPNGLHVSATMILIDETPGPKNMRTRTLALERKLIADLIDALPEDELLAVYAFNEAGTLHSLAEFTVSRKLARTAVAEMKTSGVNTHIATNLRDAIEVMAERDDVLFPNIIVITDGEEEGIAANEGLSEFAAQSGVVVSALGMFWRPEGSAQVGLAKDYLGSRLTTRDFGVSESIPLSSSKVAAERLTKFAKRYSGAIEQSGLIVPVGEAIETDLIVETIVPAVGSPGETKVVEHVAHFSGAAQTVGGSKGANQAAGNGKEAVGTESKDGDRTGAAQSANKDLLFGYPKIWFIYGGAGFGGLLFLVLIGWIISRTRPSEPFGSFDFVDDDARIASTVLPGVASLPVQSAQPRSSKPLVHLVREDTRERLTLNAPGGTIGRAPNNELILSDDGVSRIHAEIRLKAGAITISDAGSLNGSLLNGKLIKAPAPLKTGDSIGLGNVTLRVLLP
jgi:hypothetical protein